MARPAAVSPVHAATPPAAPTTRLRGCLGVWRWSGGAVGVAGASVE